MPQHIEPDGSCVHIRQAVNMVKGTPHIGPLKTATSIRDVPVPPNVQYCAVFLREQAERLVWESAVFPGQPVNPSYFRDKYRNALFRIPGVRLLTPHSCRHTFVSQLQALGVDMEIIQSLVGHADIEMTQHYLHVQEEVRQAAAKKFSKAFLSHDNIETHCVFRSCSGMYQNFNGASFNKWRTVSPVVRP